MEEKPTEVQENFNKAVEENENTKEFELTDDEVATLSHYKMAKQIVEKAMADSAGAYLGQIAVVKHGFDNGTLMSFEYDLNTKKVKVRTQANEPVVKTS